jgi:hypothetical protein
VPNSPPKPSSASKKAADPLQAAYAEYEAVKASKEAFRQKHLAIILQMEEYEQQLDKITSEVKALYAANVDEVGPAFHGFRAQARRSINAHELIARRPELAELADLSFTVAAFTKLCEKGLVSEDDADAVVVETYSIVAPKS